LKQYLSEHDIKYEYTKYVQREYYVPGNEWTRMIKSYMCNDR